MASLHHNQRATGIAARDHLLLTPTGHSRQIGLVDTHIITEDFDAPDTNIYSTIGDARFSAIGFPSAGSWTNADGHNHVGSIISAAGIAGITIDFGRECFVKDFSFWVKATGSCAGTCFNFAYSCLTANKAVVADVSGGNFFSVVGTWINHALTINLDKVRYLTIVQFTVSGNTFYFDDVVVNVLN